MSADLRRLAEAATPGPWTYDGDAEHPAIYGADESAIFVSILYHGDDPDLPFIAACDPQTILALLDERDRYRAALEALREATEPYVEEAGPGEELNGLWVRRFDRLMAARYQAREALAPPES